MSNKLRVTLGLLVLIAGFLLIRLGLFFKQSVKTATLANISGQIVQPDEENFSVKDSDHDGIPDVNEAYFRTDPSNPDTDGDGFLDGEEVISGYDQTVNDRALAQKNTEPDNITNRMASRFVGGLLAGDLNPRNNDQQKFQGGLNTLALAALDEASQTLIPPEPNEPLGLSDDSKESQEEYLKTVSGLLEGPFLTAFIAQPQTLNTAVQYVIADRFEDATKIFQEHYFLFTNAYTSLLTVPVPPKWQIFHKQLLMIFQKIALNYNAAIKISDDPILALTAIADLMNPFTEIQFSLLEQLKNLIASQNLEVPDTPLFNILNLFGNKI